MVGVAELVRACERTEADGRGIFARQKGIKCVQVVNEPPMSAGILPLDVQAAPQSTT